MADTQAKINVWNWALKTIILESNLFDKEHGKPPKQISVARTLSVFPSTHFFLIPSFQNLELKIGATSTKGESDTATPQVHLRESGTKHKHVSEVSEVWFERKIMLYGLH